jgi:malonyl-CoA/methylmalonyl-CoA synthetase
MSSSQLPLVEQAEQYGNRTALIDTAGAYTYAQLVDQSARVAAALLGGRADLGEERVAFLISPGFPWVAVQWGIWRAGGIAVPLPVGYTSPELKYLIDDTQPIALVADEQGQTILAALAATLGLRVLSYAEVMRAQPAVLPRVDSSRCAMVLYTSGTTSQPKGVVTTHANIIAQITTLVDAWQWSAQDRTVLCLPLSHVHGIINVLSCALWSGALCEILPCFDAEAVWERIASGWVTVFMAVPTIYVKLIAAWEEASPARQSALSRACARLRLTVSGSAALPVRTLQKWQEISGQRLLERYGMTEIGMALSNPLHGERVPGSVGTPLPGVEVRLVDEHGAEVPSGTPGEIEIRGPSVFKEYWRKPEATRDAFPGGWFRTGDMAVIESGLYRILGRTSVDILKTGGQKVSALEIEEVLRTHPAVAECAVVGVPDAEWGERVGAAVSVRDGHALDLDSLRSWARERLATYKIPSRLMVVTSLPRNNMGKVTKPVVAKLFQAEYGPEE